VPLPLRSPPVPLTASSLLERRDEALRDLAFDPRHMAIGPTAAIDVTAPSKPLRSLRIDARLPIVTVSSVAKQPRVIERIDLRDDWADQRLARYQLAL
jgi:hypothetical protein